MQVLFTKYLIFINIILYMTFSQALKTLKKRDRLTYEELAEICGVSKVSIANYFNEKYRPNLDVINRLVKHFPDFDWFSLLVPSPDDNGLEAQNDSAGNSTSRDLNEEPEVINDPRNSYTQTQVLMREYKLTMDQQKKEIAALKKVIETQELLIRKLSE